MGDFEQAQFVATEEEKPFGFAGYHRKPASRNDEWLTPEWVFDHLGEFDLDPCAAINPPYRTARLRYTIEDDGRHRPWFGRVWLNPPYSNVRFWMWRLANHGHGTALVFSRTDTEWFHKEVFQRATAIKFLDGRIRFLKSDGTPGEHTAGSPSVLVAYGYKDADVLQRAGLEGFDVRLRMG